MILGEAPAVGYHLYTDFNIPRIHPLFLYPVTRSALPESLLTWDEKVIHQGVIKGLLTIV